MRLAARPSADEYADLLAIGAAIVERFTGVAFEEATTDQPVYRTRLPVPEAFAIAVPSGRLLRVRLCSWSSLSLRRPKTSSSKPAMHGSVERWSTDSESNSSAWLGTRSQSTAVVVRHLISRVHEQMVLVDCPLGFQPCHRNILLVRDSRQRASRSGT